MSEQSIFVARERELAVLNAALDRALAGQGGVIFVAGEKGTGKTRLAEEFIAGAFVHAENIIAAKGAGNLAARESEPFLPFRGVMEMLASEAEGGKRKDEKPLRVRALFPEARVRENDLHRERLRKIGKTLKWVLAESAQELASAWLPGLGIGRGLLDRLAGERVAVTPQDWRERVFSQYPAAIARLADAFPLILFLDDFHWADNSSRGMLYHLAEIATRHRLLILVTWRPHDPEAPSLLSLLQELETHRWAISLSLDLLDIVPEHVARMTEFVNQFIDRNYVPNALDENFRARLVERTEGHALIVEETLRQFRLDGMLRQDSRGQWVLAGEPDWKRLPRTVESMVKLRLQGLSDEELRLLRAAAVEGAWGEEFAAQVVARVLGLEVRQVRERLDGELGRRRELVIPSRSVRVEETGQPLDWYRLRHRAFQEHLYALLSPGERRHLHAEVTLALRELLGEAWQGVPDLLAYHAGRGERWPELAEACLYLARRQRGEYDAPTAVQTAHEGLAALDKVRDSADRRQLRADLEHELGLALYYNDRYAEARPHHERAQSLYREIKDRLGEANTILALGDVHRMLDEYPQARGRYEEALPIYREIKDRLGEAHTIKALGDVHMALAEYPQARGRYEEALPIYREIKDRLGEANTLTAFGSLSLAEENYAAARDWFEQASGIYCAIGERHWRTYVAPHLARALLALDDVETAAQVLEQGAELARAIEGQPNLATILWLLAQLREALKDFSAALACYNELLTLSPDDPDLLHRRASVLFELKDYFSALADYHRLLELDANDAWAHNGVANVREKEGDLEGALAAYLQAIAAKPEEAAFVRNRASTLIALGRLDEARTDCETASRLAPDHLYTHGRWGDLHLACGEWAEAEARYRTALAQDDSPGWRFDLAVALWGLGRMDESWAEFDAALAKADAGTRAEAARDYRRLLACHPTLSCLAEAMERLTGI